MLSNYADMAAYLDWSGLRPMSELEYEKACRGTRPVTADEYAWGDVSVKAGPVYIVTNPGAANEIINAVPVIGNAAYNATNGIRPYRVGAIAASQVAPNRVEAGATYYGIMEMSGNEYELEITVGRAEGRVFDGAHGDGNITAAGLGDVTNWPAANLGFGLRGGCYHSSYPAIYMRVSSRYLGHYWNTTTRQYHYGGRGVRTAQ